MKEYKKFLEEAAKRDHRRIGKVQSTFPLARSKLELTLSIRRPIIHRIKNSSSSMIYPPVPLSGYHTVLVSTTLLSSSCE
jgi:threonyl-tRNA synthetase